MNNLMLINRYLYNTIKESMFITVTEIQDDSRIPIRVNINHIKYFTRVVDETGDSDYHGTFIYLVGTENDYIHAEEEAAIIVKRINNAINKPLFNFN